MPTLFRPHLLEVNTMPSLFIDKGACEEIDTRLKMPLVAETLNIVGHHISTGQSGQRQGQCCVAIDHFRYRLETFDILLKKNLKIN